MDRHMKPCMLTSAMQLHLISNPMSGQQAKPTGNIFSHFILLRISSCTHVFFFFSRDGDKMAPSVEKKIAELEMGLLHLQQNIDIPEISLAIHQTVASMIKKCEKENRKPKVADFGDNVEDAQFLNALQSGVNRWIREIQKV